MINNERLEASKYADTLSTWNYAREAERERIALLCVDFMKEVFPDRPFDKDARGEERCLFHRCEMHKAYIFGYQAGKRGDAALINMQDLAKKVCGMEG